MIIAAERQELGPLMRRLHWSQPLKLGLPWAAAGKLGCMPVALVAGRSGRANAAFAARRVAERWPLRGLVSAGWCGALDPKLRVGEVVIADRVMTEEGASEAVAQPAGGRAAIGPVLTVDRFVTTAAEKRRLRERGAIAVEMEAAALALEAREMGIPFYCVRAVSDLAEKTFQVDFNRARLPGGRFSPLRAAAQAGISIGRWTELLVTWRDAARAAEALGDFVASCRFSV